MEGLGAAVLKREERVAREADRAGGAGGQEGRCARWCGNRSARGRWKWSARGRRKWSARGRRDWSARGRRKRSTRGRRKRSARGLRSTITFTAPYATIIIQAKGLGHIIRCDLAHELVITPPQASPRARAGASNWSVVYFVNSRATLTVINRHAAHWILPYNHVAHQGQSQDELACERKSHGFICAKKIKDAERGVGLRSEHVMLLLCSCCTCYLLREGE